MKDYCFKGSKFDAGKLRWHLLPWPMLEDLVKVLEFGAQKYGENNWMHVENGSQRYWNATIRHLLASGNDEETGLPHMAHACCSLLFSWWHGEKIKARPSTMSVAGGFYRSKTNDRPQNGKRSFKTKIRSRRK